MYSLKNTNSNYVAVIGIDWADDKHDFHIHFNGEEEALEISSKPREIRDWFLDFGANCDYQKIAVISEQKNGLLINCLSNLQFIDIYVINTTCVNKYRELLRPSKAKDDSTDALYISNLFFEHPKLVRILKKQTSDAFNKMTSLRRKTVDARKAASNQLRAAIKECYPVIFEIFPSNDLYSKLVLSFIEKWPSMQTLKDSRPREYGAFFRKHGARKPEKNNERIDKIKKSIEVIYDSLEKKIYQLQIESLVKLIRQLNETIESYDDLIKKEAEKYEDYKIFKSLPGAGEVLAPRLFAFFGTDKAKFESLKDVHNKSEIPPVKIESGKSKVIRRRYLCNKFIQQTFMEFAEASIKHSVWAKAYYESKKLSTSYYTIARALAFKWIRILYALWKNNETYDEDRYLQILLNKKVHYLKGYENVA